MSILELLRHTRDTFRKRKELPFALPRIRPIGFRGIRMEWSSDNAWNIQGSVFGSIRVMGRRNRVELGQGAIFSGHVTIEGSDNVVIIGCNCRISAKIMIKGDKQTVSIGEETTCQSVHLLCQENCDITIGRACMFSRDVEIRTTDAHSLVDRKTGQRLNRPASIVIGDHVWIGVGALISKGSRIAEDSVVGAKSFVNKSFEESGIVLAGTPAIIIRRGVTWNRGRQCKFSDEELGAWRVPGAQGGEPRNDPLA